jgi:hypothetical protein
VTFLPHLGDTRHAAGNLRRTREDWLQALDILAEMEIQHPDADQVCTKLDGAGELGKRGGRELGGRQVKTVGGAVRP